jgi:DNA-directed RNA polymerase subunit H (RpoH/RPB5)
MDERALLTLKDILTARGLKGDFETVGNPMDETKMYTFNGVLIIFSEKTRVTIQEVNNYLTFASENGYTSGIIVVSPSRPSESVLEVIREHISNKENQLVQIFEIRHLQLDISKHRDVPKHRIITEEEAQAVLKEFNLTTAKQLPKIDSQDAMARWVGARPGDVLEITGLCVSSAENRRYRLCVSNVYEG